MPSASRILIVVPARGGSKRLPGKNLRRLGGRPLIDWTLSAARASGLDAACLLTTDDARIREVGRRLGFWAPFLRPAELATDQATTEAAVLHALDETRALWGEDPELLMLLQPTTPFRSGADLRAAVEMLDRAPTADAVLSVKPVNRNEMQLFKTGADGRLSPLGAGAEPVVTANGALYLIRTAAFRAHQRFTPPATLPFRGAPEADIDIDDANDWALAEIMLKRQAADRQIGTAI